MKFVLCVLSLNAIALLFPGIRADSLHCFKLLGLDSEVSYDAVPTFRSDKCLFECMLRSVGVMNNYGLINVTSFMDSLKSLSSIIRTLDSDSLKMVEEIMEKCNNQEDLTGDKCRTTAVLLDCAAQESKIHGWSPTQIVTIILAPYYADYYYYASDPSIAPLKLI